MYFDFCLNGNRIKNRLFTDIQTNIRFSPYVKCSVEGEKGIDRDRGEPVGSRRNIGGVGILWVDDGKPHDGVTDRQTIVLLAL